MDLAHLEKSFRALLLVPVPWLAFLNANGVAHLVRATLAHRVDLVAPSLRRAPSAAPFHATSGDAILARNPFDSQTGPFARRRERGTDPADDPAAPLLAPPCDGVRVVVIAKGDEPDDSIAAVQSGTDPRPLLRRRGGRVGARRVVFVAWDRVWMDDDAGRLCQSAMFTDQVTTTKSKDDATQHEPPPLGLDPELAKGIHREGATAFEIDRGVVERVLRDAPSLLGSTRVRVDKEGLRVTGVGPTTVLGALGLLEGDHLESLNGFDLTRPESGLEAYARLPGAPKLVLRLNRAGKEIELDYAVR